MIPTLKRKCFSPEQLVKRLKADHTANRRIVMTNGCFDVIHAGHVRYLRSARSLGDRLIVALNDDDSVRRLKGSGRPVYPLAERAEILSAFPFINYLTSFSTESVLPLIHQLRPDVLAKGGDYPISQVVGYRFVRGYGGEVVVLDHAEGRSTTETLKVVSGR